MHKNKIQHIGCAASVIVLYVGFGVPILSTEDAVRCFSIEHSRLRTAHFRAEVANHLRLQERECTEAVFENCRFPSVRCRNTDFSKARLTKTFLSHANIQNCNFEHADLRFVNLYKAQIWKSDLSHADMRSVRLEAATIMGCDLHEADLANIKLEECHYDAATKWPTGFDPRSHGAILSITLSPSSQDKDVADEVPSG